MGQLSQDGPSLRHPEDDSDFMRLKTLSDQAIMHIAAACDEHNIKHEWEFQSAQNHKMITGECPSKTDSDCQCMAALVKVNGLEAYALLDSGSTTISITNNFARVAKLSILQLENSVMLQLGTIGS